MDEQEIDDRLAQAFGSQVNKWFFAKVAGVSRENWDGVARAAVIEECEEGDLLELVREPDNSYDSNAVMVLRRPDGAQLGYLDQRAAAEVSQDTGRGRFIWLAILAHHNFHPDTNAVVGATIALARLPILPEDFQS